MPVFCHFAAAKKLQSCQNCRLSTPRNLLSAFLSFGNARSAHICALCHVFYRVLGAYIHTQISFDIMERCWTCYSHQLKVLFYMCVCVCCRRLPRESVREGYENPAYDEPMVARPTNNNNRGEGIIIVEHENKHGKHN